MSVKFTEMQPPCFTPLDIYLAETILFHYMNTLINKHVHDQP